MNSKQTLLAGAIAGAIGVALGAFGAHALKPMLVESGRLETFELAVRYEFYHALALLAVGILQKQSDKKLFSFSAMSFLYGMILFSGSLYALCLTNISGFAIATPFGGVLLITGWILLIIGLAKTNQK